MSDRYGDHLITHTAPEGLMPGREPSRVPTKSPPHWPMPLALAATFLLGVGVGQVSGRSPDTSPGSAGAPSVLVDATVPLGSGDDAVPVRMVLYAPDAGEVTVAGSFNGWDPEAARLERSQDGLYHTVISVPHGRHEYMFVIDGERWVTDPTAALAVDDGFGHRNAVLEI